MSIRRALAIAGLLSIGAAINLSVVAACARWGYPYKMQWAWAAHHTTDLPEGVDAWLNEPRYLNMFGTGRKTKLEVSVTASLVCTRREYTRWHDHSFAYARSQTFVQLGVPFRSMQYAERSSLNIAAFPGFDVWRLPGRAGGWPFADEAVGMWGEFLARPPHVYPLTIMPIGFAANTLIYALLAWSVFFAPGVIRRRSRRRRGLCLRCAYPRGSLPVCPECGTPSPATPPVAQ